MKFSLLGNIIDFLFPRYCAICDERLLGTEEMLCATCLQDLPITPTWEAPYENNAIFGLEMKIKLYLCT